MTFFFYIINITKQQWRKINEMDFNKRTNTRRK